MLSLGLMSGTSMDGIEADLLKTDGTPNLLQELGNTTLEYAPECKILLKLAEFSVRKHLGDLRQVRLRFSTMMEEYFSKELNLPEHEQLKKKEALANYLY